MGVSVYILHYTLSISSGLSLPLVVHFMHDSQLTLYIQGGHDGKPLSLPHKTDTEPDRSVCRPGTIVHQLLQRDGPRRNIVLQGAGLLLFC